jgi:nucleotide-binding universal stress UspA family protein
MFRRILMALKFASASEFALVKGAELAKIHGAQLHIFHAMDYVLAELDESDPKVVELRKDAEAYYESRVKPLLGDLKDVTFKCLPADPAMEVIKQAMQLDVDLIILGCHQLPQKMCLGRVDYVGITILEKAPCPVMLVPLCE